jgi:hypothetical protein
LSTKPKTPSGVVHEVDGRDWPTGTAMHSSATPAAVREEVTGVPSSSRRTTVRRASAGPLDQKREKIPYCPSWSSRTSPTQASADVRQVAGWSPVSTTRSPTVMRAPPGPATTSAVEVTPPSLRSTS